METIFTSTEIKAMVAFDDYNEPIKVEGHLE